VLRGVYPRSAGTCLDLETGKHLLGYMFYSDTSLRSISSLVVIVVSGNVGTFNKPVNTILKTLFPQLLCFVGCGETIVLMDVDSFPGIIEPNIIHFCTCIIRDIGWQCSQLGL